MHWGMRLICISFILRTAASFSHSSLFQAKKTPIYLLSSPLFLFFNFTDGRAGVRSHYILNFSSLFLFLKFNDGRAGVRSQFPFIFYPFFLFFNFTDFFGSPQTVMLLSIYCYLIPMFNSQQSLLFNVFQQLLLSIQIAFSFSTKHSFPSWFILFSIFPCHLPPLYYTDCWLTSNSYATIHSLKSHPNFQFSAPHKLNYPLVRCQ